MLSSTRDRLMSNIQAVTAEMISDTMAERGHGYASDREAWAELKEQLERTKSMHSGAEKLHKEMWDAIKAKNRDAFAAFMQELERSSRIMAEEWVLTSALAKIAITSEEKRIKQARPPK